MPVQSNEEFLDALEQGWYDTALPFERYFMNRMRRREGLPPLRRTF